MAADANVDTSIVFAKFKHYVEILNLTFLRLVVDTVLLLVSALVNKKKRNITQPIIKRK